MAMRDHAASVTHDGTNVKRERNRWVREVLQHLEMRTFELFGLKVAYL